MSLDPLGTIRVILYGSHSGKLVPLIVCDLSTGAIAIENMQGNKAENVFLGLQRLQFQFRTQIIQAYTDKGSQLGQMLGYRNDF